MKYIVRQYFIYAGAAHILTLMVPAFTIAGNWKDFLYAVLLLTVLFFLVKPLANILFFPLHLITLNLSAWLLNIALVLVWALVSSAVEISPWNFPGISIASVSISPVQLSYWPSAMSISFLLVLIINISQWLLA